MPLDTGIVFDGCPISDTTKIGLSSNKATYKYDTTDDEDLAEAGRSTQTCTITAAGGDSDSCIPTTCDNHCYYTITFSRPRTSSYNAGISATKCPIGDFISNNIVRMVSVYPFEGPDIAGDRYRAIMYAHSTKISGGNINTNSIEYSEDDPEYWQDIDRLTHVIPVTGGVNSNTMLSLSSYDETFSPIAFDGIALISKEPESIDPNTDNNYTFHLSYSDSSSSSSSSCLWCPVGCSFLIVYRHKSGSGKSTIKKGSKDVPRSYSYEDSVTLKGFQYIFGNTDTPSSDAKSVLKIVRTVSGDPKNTEQLDESSSSVYMTIEDALEEIGTRCEEYKSKKASTDLSYSEECPNYKYDYDEVEVLCTYIHTYDEVADDYILSANAMSWATGGIKTLGFYTQLNSSDEIPSEMSDILSAGDEYTYNHKFTANMRLIDRSIQ